MSYSHRHFETIDSTSTYLKNNYDDVTNFTFISADYQSVGRGRTNRKWFSPIGENLLFSFLIKDKGLIEIFNILSIASAITLSKFFLEKFNIESEIKWPNDIYIKGKKVTGILLESHMSNNEIDGLIIGIGTNVNQTIFNQGLIVEPTSLKIELGYDIDIVKMREELFNYIYLEFNKIKEGDRSFFDYLKNHNYLKNKKVIANIKGINKEVIVLDINQDCSLQVLDEDKIYDVISGEVTFHIN